ncbi:hypothetical protein Q5Y75_01460 [Ruegeria sp. 2205SS24-7]|uniref:hypothetical protein n=1 Tax=Ruegeria discodermiae TaxID=3064389 RepID=UPI002741BB39|nr:hypothetical protein [Ruegeria sp. 2205SS24-7]MDP5215876.1 hypothetical protein [Ruegeria sp. 2205SS24-7]
MKLRIIMTATVLSLAPGLALAMGCNYGHDQQTQSCAPGTVWDADSQSCAPIVNS